MIEIFHAWLRGSIVSARTSASADRARRVEEHEVQTRLRTLLELAISIGSRERLLGEGTSPKGKTDNGGDSHLLAGERE